MDFSNYPISSYAEARDPGKATDPLFDLAAARTYLAEKARMCAKAAESENPVEVWLAIGLVGNRKDLHIRRSRETYSLECYNCRREIEIPTQAPHSCPKCGMRLVIEWRPE